MSFICQQCKQLLQLDASLVDLTPSAYDIIAASLPPSPASSRYLNEAEKLAHVPASDAVKAAWKRSAPNANPRTQPRKLQGNSAPNESYVFLQDSVVHNIPFPNANETTNTHGKPKDSRPQPVAREPSQLAPTPLSHHLRSTVRLFTLLSSRTDLDHPLCAECTHILLSTLQRQLEETKKERDGYIAFDKDLRKEKEKDDEASLKDLERQIEKFKQEEAAIIKEMREAQSEQEQLEEELKSIALEEKELEEEEAE